MKAGIDLGGTKIQAVVVDSKGNVRGEARHPTPTQGGPEDVCAEMADTLREAVAGAGAELGGLAGVGVGSPGAVNSETGEVAEARNLPGWNGAYPLAGTLSELVDLPAYVGNDVTVAVEGEYKLGAGRGSKSLVGVWWGTGVGGGIILDGKTWHGRGAAGEIGHIVIKRDGALCPCGRRGCMEAYAGRAAMEARARKLVEEGEETDLFKIMEKRGRTRLQSGIWDRALKRDDDMAVRLIDRAVEALAAGIASVVNLLDVETVVIGGGLGTRLGEPYIRRIAKAMQQHLFVDDNPPAVVPAALGDLGGAIGASLLVPARKRARSRS